MHIITLLFCRSLDLLESAFASLPFPSVSDDVLYVITAGKIPPNSEQSSENSAGVQSKITVHYKISGNRRIGAHAPVKVGSSDATAEDPRTLTFTNTFVLQTPVLEQFVAVGMLPIPSRGPRVGQQVVFQWRIERLKAGWIKPKSSSEGNVQSGVAPTDKALTSTEAEVRRTPRNESPTSVFILFLRRMIVLWNRVGRPLIAR